MTRIEKLAYQREWYKTNKNSARNGNWREQGILNFDGTAFTVIDYDRNYQIQQGYCKMCKKHQSKLNKPLAADHDHITGVFRGLLCTRCNTVLGLYENQSLQSIAKQYLKNFQCSFPRELDKK